MPVTPYVRPQPAPATERAQQAANAEAAANYQNFQLATNISDRRRSAYEGRAEANPAAAYSRTATTFDPVRGEWSGGIERNIALSPAATRDRQEEAAQQRKEQGYERTVTPNGQVLFRQTGNIDRSVSAYDSPKFWANVAERSAEFDPRTGRTADPHYRNTMAQGASMKFNEITTRLLQQGTTGEQPDRADLAILESLTDFFLPGGEHPSYGGLPNLSVDVVRDPGPVVTPGETPGGGGGGPGGGGGTGGGGGDDWGGGGGGGGGYGYNDSGYYPTYNYNYGGGGGGGDYEPTIPPWAYGLVQWRI